MTWELKEYGDTEYIDTPLGQICVFRDLQGKGYRYGFGKVRSKPLDSKDIAKKLALKSLFSKVLKTKDILEKEMKLI